MKKKIMKKKIYLKKIIIINKIKYQKLIKNIIIFISMKKYMK